MTYKKIALSFIVLLFSFIAFFGAYSDYTNDNEKIYNIELVQKKLTLLTYIDDITMQLQKERGLSAIYYEERSAKYLKTLEIQRKKTSICIEKASKHIDINELTLKRQEAIEIINTNSKTRFQAFMKYTSLIDSLLHKSELLIIETKNSNIKNSLIFYNHLNIMQELAGELRGLIGGILTTKTITKQEYNEIIILNNLLKKHYESVHGNIALELSFEKESIVATFKTINTIIDMSGFKDKSLTDIKTEPLKWFKIASCSVTTIRESVVKEIDYIHNVIETSMNNAKSIERRHMLLWLTGSIIIIIIFIIALILFKRLNKEQQLLKNYKDVIDNNPNSIVSKTDKNGNITYVNDTFCTVSKYSKEELIGKPHSIVRHEDTPAEAFKELWDTIESGNSWNGIIKNRCKDGSIYWVDAFISPIYDDKNNLVEYIALRHDITDMILQNEETERTQRELIYRMGESVESRSKESGNHIRRVAHYSKTLALLYGLSEEESEVLFIASTMHDMGKIAIPDAILLKPAKLDKDEFSIMKTHSEIGYKLLSGSNLPLLKMASTIAHEHHEHFNGNGYPVGTKGNDISIYARIVAIVDVFDALISDRVYKKAWDLNTILEHFKNESSQQFDPVLVKLFLNNIDKFMGIREKFKDL